MYELPPAWKFNSAVPKIYDAGILASFLRPQIDVGSPNILCSGPTGVGKSESMIDVIQRTYPQFSIKDDVVFTRDEFWDKIDIGKGNPWRCKLLDDFGSELDATEYSSKPTRDIIHYLQTIRTDNTAIFVTTPVKNFLNKDVRERIADYFIDLKVKNISRNYARGTIHYNQRNNVLQKSYNHSLCDNGNSRINNKFIGTKIWSWIFYPPPEALHNEYLPYRIAKNEANKEKGKANAELLKMKSVTEEQAAKDIISNPTPYIVVTKGRKPKLNKELIAFDKKLSVRSTNNVCAKVKSELHL